MSGNVYDNWNGQYDDPPPYSLVAQLGPESYPLSIFQTFSLELDPPPSYSSLDLSNPTSDPFYSSLDLPNSTSDPFYSSLDLPNSTSDPSYSPLDLLNSTSDPSPQISQTTQSRLVEESPKYTEVTRIPRGCEVPSYICWSMFNVIFFPPVGLIALIFSLQVCMARKRNHAGLAWKSHVIARKVNIAATSLGIMAAVYYAIAVPLMFLRMPERRTHQTSVSRLGNT